MCRLLSCLQGLPLYGSCLFRMLLVLPPFFHVTGTWQFPISSTYGTMSLPSFLVPVFLSFSICPCLHKAQRHGHVFKLCSPRIVVISHSSLCCYCWLVLVYFFRQVFCRHFSALKFNMATPVLILYVFYFLKEANMASRLQAPVGRRPRQGPPGGPARSCSLRLFSFLCFFSLSVCMTLALSAMVMMTHGNDTASRLQAPVGRRPRQGPPGGPTRNSPLACILIVY